MRIKKSLFNRYLVLIVDLIFNMKNILLSFNISLDIILKSNMLIPWYNDGPQLKRFKYQIFKVVLD